jgi:hypothetical protein
MDSMRGDASGDPCDPLEETDEMAPIEDDVEAADESCGLRASSVDALDDDAPGPELDALMEDAADMADRRPRPPPKRESRWPWRSPRSNPVAPS